MQPRSQGNLRRGLACKSDSAASRSDVEVRNVSLSSDAVNGRARRVVAQDQVRVERYVRQPDGFWLLAEYGEEAGDVIISTLDVLLPLVEVYEGVAFPKT